MKKQIALFAAIADGVFSIFGMIRYGAARQESEDRSSLASQRAAAAKVYQSSGTGRPGMPPGMPGGSPLTMMAKDLDLSPDQQKKLEEAFKSMPPMQGDPRQGMAAMRSKLDAILTPAQREKMAQFGGRAR